MNQEQFKKEILPLRPRLLSYATRIVEDQNDAEDIIQEVFIKLWDMRKDLHQYNSILAFSTTVTKNLCLNKLRLTKRIHHNLDDITVVYDGLSPDRALEEKEEIRQVTKIIDELPTLQQAVMKMRHWDGLEISKISELTGSTEEAIRVNLSRARKRVKDLFLKTQ